MKCPLRRRKGDKFNVTCSTHQCEARAECIKYCFERWNGANSHLGWNFTLFHLAGYLYWHLNSHLMDIILLISCQSIGQNAAYFVDGNFPIALVIFHHLAICIRLLYLSCTSILSCTRIFLFLLFSFSPSSSFPLLLLLASYINYTISFNVSLKRLSQPNMIKWM